MFIYYIFYKNLHYPSYLYIFLKNFYIIRTMLFDNNTLNMIRLLIADGKKPKGESKYE